MYEPFLGAIVLFGFNFVPRGWASCNGQLMSISQNSALYALLGTTYGGNGTSTFALPDLRGRVPISMGQGPGLSPNFIGQVGGTETRTLLLNNMPQHNHSLNASSAAGDASSPATAFPANSGALDKEYISSVPSGAAVQMNPAAIGFAGGNQPFDIRPPYLVLNFCIALEGVFPSRS